MSRSTRTVAPEASARAANGHRLSDVLGERRWIRRKRPFPHVIAYDVFRPVAYRRLEEAFTELLAETADRPYMERHDIDGRTVDEELAGRFAPLLGRDFHDLLAGALGIVATGHVAVGMHHHRVGSQHGFPHNDLNPGWFRGTPSSEELVYTGPHVDYTSGASLDGDTTVAPTETVRAASLLFYLANPPWEDGDGGVTGLYRSATDDIEHPVGFAPPLNNSILLFECTPSSFHGFIGNRRSPRNSIVMWLHRPKRDVVARWGEHAIVPYGLVPPRKAAR
jgi:2OG-Fe(II) oxygenase superfamily